MEFVIFLRLALLLGLLPLAIGYGFQVRMDPEEEYDFIIVGGGTSGLTVADRLTEDPNTTVLVIEYGDFDQGEDYIKVPGLFISNLTDLYKKYAMVGYTEPNSGVFDNGEAQPIRIATVVGGYSVINSGYYDRNSKENFDAWVKLGNEGWGWTDILPYLKKSETFTPSPEALAEEYNITWDLSVHGNNGPVPSSMPVFAWPEASYFKEAWNSLGIRDNVDGSSGDATGFIWAPSQIDPKDETRTSARTAHYDNIAPKRPNYHLITRKAASKIVFEGNIATGVQYIDRGTGNISLASARKEVIIAAGAVRTPQLLQLSGLGPSSLLEGLGIETLVDLPVGYNIQDFQGTHFEYNFTSRPFPNPALYDTNSSWQSEQLDLYYKEHKGPYTSSYAVDDGWAYLSLSQITPDYQSIIDQSGKEDAAKAYSAGTVIPETISKGYDVQRQIIASLYASNTTPTVTFDGFQTVGIANVRIVQPLSRGTVFINNTNIFELPKIDNYVLGTDTDRSILLASFKKSREYLNTPAFAPLGLTETYPGTNISTDEEILEAMKSFGGATNRRLCCSSPMMPRENGGVVDTGLLVYGVRNLSIVGVGIPPITDITASLDSTIYAIAEKAADIIKKRHSIPL